MVVSAIVWMGADSRSQHAVGSRISFLWDSPLLVLHCSSGINLSRKISWQSQWLPIPASASMLRHLQIASKKDIWNGWIIFGWRRLINSRGFDSTHWSLLHKRNQQVQSRRWAFPERNSLGDSHLTRDKFWPYCWFSVRICCQFEMLYCIETVEDYTK